MDGIGKEISENQTVLFIVPSSRYSESITKIALAASSVCNKTCYLSLNRSASILTSAFRMGKVDVGKMIFIDTMEKSSIRQSNNPNVFYVSSPKATTEMGINITKAITRGIDSLIFDSVSSMLIYHDPQSVLKFLHYLVSKMRISGKKCIIICLDKDMESDLINKLGMFIDRVVKL